MILQVASGIPGPRWRVSSHIFQDFWRWRYRELSEKVTDGSHEPPPGMQWEWGGARNDTDWCLGNKVSSEERKLCHTACETWTCPKFARDVVRDMFLAKPNWDEFHGISFGHFMFSAFGWGNWIGEGTDEFGNHSFVKKKSWSCFGPVLEGYVLFDDSDLLDPNAPFFGFYMLRWAPP